MLAVAELAANSIRHGGGRGILRIWRDGDDAGLRGPRPRPDPRPARRPPRARRRVARRPRPLDRQRGLRSRAGPLERPGHRRAASHGREAQDQLSGLERDVELRGVADAVELDPLGVERAPVALRRRPATAAACPPAPRASAPGSGPWRRPAASRGGGRARSAAPTSQCAHRRRRGRRRRPAGSGRVRDVGEQHAALLHRERLRVVGAAGRSERDDRACASARGQHERQVAAERVADEVRASATPASSIAASTSVARSKSPLQRRARRDGPAAPGSSTSSWRSSSGRTRSHVRGESTKPCRQTITASGSRPPWPRTAPAAPGPALGQLVQLGRHGAGGLEVAPDEHGRAGAGDRRAERAERLRGLDELPRARVEVRAARLVDAVAEAARDERRGRRGRGRARAARRGRC